MLDTLSLVVVLYLAYVARCRPDSPTIFSLNALLGWTIAGWIAALVWALEKDGAERSANNRPSGTANRRKTITGSMQS